MKHYIFEQPKFYFQIVQIFLSFVRNIFTLQSLNNCIGRSIFLPQFVLIQQFSLLIHIKLAPAKWDQLGLHPVLHLVEIICLQKIWIHHSVDLLPEPDDQLHAGHCQAHPSHHQDRAQDNQRTNMSHIISEEEKIKWKRWNKKDKEKMYIFQIAFLC